MKVLDIFSGIGGFSLGLERAGFTTVAFCEINPFCRKILAKHWPTVPCYEDIRTLTAKQLKKDGIEVEVLCGGFPCQDISAAGKKEGINGSRSGLWKEYARIICELRPRYIIVENVSNLLGWGLSTVLGDLAEIGYSAEWHCIPASCLGYPHRRDRAWIIAYPNRNGSQKFLPFHGSIKKICESQKPKEIERGITAERLYRLPNSSSIRRGDGLPGRVDRIRSLGNAVVPEIPMILGMAILEAEGGKT